MQNRRFNLQYAGAGVVLALSVLGLAGCAQPMNEPSMTGARDTGTYPNLNIKPGAAAEQISEQKRVAETANLKAAGQSNAAADSSVPNDFLWLRKVGATHDKEALKEIEGN